MVAGRPELGPVAGRRVVAFVDPSGGSMDFFTLGLAHGDGETAVLDLVEEGVPPFSPEAVVGTFALTCKRYHVTEVVGDAYAGELPREFFRQYGIHYRISEEMKSEISLRALPMMTSGRVELLREDR